MKHVTEAFIISPEYLKAIIDCVEDPICVKDQQYRFVFLNNEACEMFNVSPEQWLGKTDYDLFPREQADIFRTHDNHVFETGEKDVNEEEITDGQGNIRTIIVKKTLHINNAGEKYIVGTMRDITDRKRAEKALKKSEELFRTMVETSSDIIMLLDQDLKRTYVSPGVEAILGYSAEEYLLLDNADLIHPDFIDVSKAKRCWAMDHPGEPVTFISRIRHKDGSWRWIEVTGRNLLHDPNVRASVINYHDITEKRRSEEALRTSQIQLSEAMDLSNIVYWELDLTDDMFIFNDAFYAFYGTTAEREGGYRMSGKEYVKRFIHPDDQWNKFHRLGQNIPRPGIEVLPDLEHRIVRRDGEVRHILARTKIVRDDSGHIIRRYGVNQDITDRKRAEETITKEKERLKTISDNAPFGMAIVDKEYHFTLINRKFTELFGYDLSDVPDIETWREKAFPDNEYRQTVVASVREDFADARPGDRRPRVFAVTCKDGTQKTVQFIVSVLATGDNLITFEDITELRKLENRLRQAQKTEAIGTLTGGIAHDFNNIITALMGYGALLKMAIKRGRSRGYVEQILSASEKAADLVQKLLAFSRQQTISLKPASIHEIIRTTQGLLKRLLTEDIVIETHLAAENITVMADTTQIDQILFNLATNARDAMPQGGTFTIETKAVELSDEFQHIHGYGKPGRYVLLSVSDTGVGIDEATQERIFDPFFTTKEVGKGTGLGLSTVYGIVKQHNGFINVYSEPNMGTTFHIYLPAIVTAGKEEEPSAVPIVGGDETILVAEDNESVRGLIREMLITYGYTIIEATDGVDAVDKFKKADKIDLLVFDSVMPKKNGREAYNEIRKIKQDIKVLFTSGHTRDVILDKGIEDKKFNFLQKPIVPDILLRKVREVLD